MDTPERRPEATAARVNDAGGAAAAVTGDLSDRLAITHLAARLSGPFGPPTILVHVPHRADEATNAPTALERWDDGLTRELTAPWLLLESLWPEAPDGAASASSALDPPALAASTPGSSPPELPAPQSRLAGSLPPEPRVVFVLEREPAGEGGSADRGFARSAAPALARTLAETTRARGLFVNALDVPAMPPSPGPIHDAWQDALCGALVFLVSSAARGVNGEVLRLSRPAPTIPARC